ncbi:hypothetical protein J1605_004579 [Eschrichtius robustus]|uniref:Solute carrier family 22 member 23 n=1 Tax=Eschrichtius robustus TaxID=9764 RepID=A0AB34HFV5_ESCRO|nr:hypothetical protein J1605_004579 [Eschrichtius robustus]
MKVNQTCPCWQSRHLRRIGWVRLTCLGLTCEWVAWNSEFPEHWDGRRGGIELCPPGRRFLITMVASFVATAGQLLMPGLAALCRDWQVLQALIICPFLLMLLYWSCERLQGRHWLLKAIEGLGSKAGQLPPAVGGKDSPSRRHRRLGVCTTRGYMFRSEFQLLSKADRRTRGPRWNLRNAGAYRHRLRASLWVPSTCDALQRLPGVGATRPRPCLVEQLTKEGNLTRLLRGRRTVSWGNQDNKKLHQRHSHVWRVFKNWFLNVSGFSECGHWASVTTTTWELFSSTSARTPPQAEDSGKAHVQPHKEGASWPGVGVAWPVLVTVPSESGEVSVVTQEATFQSRVRASLPLTASPTPIAAWGFLTQDSVV